LDGWDEAMSILVNAYYAQHALPPLDFPRELKGLRDRADLEPDALDWLVRFEDAASDEADAPT
jgi:hypothetical protein